MSERVRIEGTVDGRRYTGELNDASWDIVADGVPTFQVPVELSTLYSDYAKAFAEDWIRRVYAMRKRAP